MKNKKLHLLLTISILVIFCTTALLFMGCKEEQWRQERRAVEAWEEQKKIKEDEAIAAEEEAEEGALTEEETAASEENKSFPNEPVTYTGSLSGLPVTLTVNFKTTEVTGSMPSIAKGFPDTIVTDGEVYLDTLEIYASFTGVSEMDSDGNVIETSWLTMTGKISDDLIKINVETLNQEGESGEFTLTR